MKINWKSVNDDVMGAMGTAIAICIGGALVAGAGWIMLWLFKALAAMFWSVF